MNKQESSKIIYIIQATYPQSYQRFGEKEMSNMLEAWHSILCDYDYPTACAGLKAYMANDKNGFPPSPGQIIDHIHKLTESREDRLTEGEAWRLVQKAIGNGIYGAEEEFEKLPELVQRTVGSPNVLRTWAQEDVESMSVIQSNFQRAFRTAQERHREDRKMPESVRALVDNLTGKLPQIEGGKHG